MAPKINIYVLKALVWTFEALLPRADTDQQEQQHGSGSGSGSGVWLYYERLGLVSMKNVTQEDIRKAYKKKSLQLHPDKIAQFQRGKDLTAAEIAKQFQDVKEAYEILSDIDKRRIYDGFSGSPIGVTLISNPEQLMDPMSISRNLSQASFLNKSKLFLLLCLFFGLILCQPILICSKIDQTLSADANHNENDSNNDNSQNSDDGLATTKWVLIMIPIWFFSSLALMFLTSMNVIASLSSKSRSRSWSVWVDWNLWKLVGIVTQLVFLAIRWDQYIHWKYVIVLIPLFCYQALQFIQAIVYIRTVKEDVSKMVTVEYLEKHVLNNNSNNNDSNEGSSLFISQVENGINGRKYEDLNDDEKDDIGKQYIIVHIPPDAAAAAAAAQQSDGNPLEQDIDTNDNDREDELMFHQIVLSPEYQQRMNVLDMCYAKIQSVVLFRIAFFVLLVLKLDQHKGWDWFLVFIPLWLEITWNIIRSCLVCCYSTTPYYDTTDDDDHDVDDVDDEEIVAGTNTTKDVSYHLGEEGTSSTVIAAAASAKNEVTTVHTKLSQPLVPTTEGIETVMHTTTTSASSNKDTNHVNVTRPSGSNYPDMSPLYAREDMNPRTSTSTSTAATKVTPNSTHNDNGEIPASSHEKYDWHEGHDGDDNISVDEEAMESNSMERQGKACTICCTQIFISILLTLFLVKLNQADAFVKHLTPDTGYSSYWVLFPPFFICGLFFCCCCLTIYSGLDPDSLPATPNFSNKNNNKNDTTDTNNNNNETSEQPQDKDPITIIIPPTPVLTPLMDPKNTKQQTTNVDVETPKTAIEDLHHISYDDELD